MATKKIAREEPLPAPGPLGIVQDFLNTARNEVWTNPNALGRWLATRGLAPTDVRLGEADRQRAINTREALLALVSANRTGKIPAAAVERLDAMVGGSRFELRLDADGSPRVEPIGEGLDLALGRVMEAVVAAHQQGLWPLFKACADDGCRRAYYDTSRARTGKWCTRRCGERMRARAFRKGGKYKTYQRLGR